MNEIVNNWLRSSQYDIGTAQALYESKRYVYVIFMCHLSVEKALKAIFVDRKKNTPPKTHDLLRLIELGEINVPDSHRPIIAHLNEASVPTRYPEDMSKLVRHYNRLAAQRYLKETKGLLRWLRTLVK